MFSRFLALQHRENKQVQLAATQSLMAHSPPIKKGTRTQGPRKVVIYSKYGVPVKSSDFAGKRSHSDANGDFQEKKRESILEVGVHVACGDVEPQRNVRILSKNLFSALGKTGRYTNPRGPAKSQDFVGEGAAAERAKSFKNLFSVFWKTSKCSSRRRRP